MSQYDQAQRSETASRTRYRVAVDRDFEHRLVQREVWRSATGSMRRHHLGLFITVVAIGMLGLLVVT